MGYRPVEWHLPQLSKEGWTHHEMIRHFFPDAGLREAALAAIRTVLAKHFGKEIMLYCEDVSSKPFSDIVQQMGENGVIAIMGMPPVTSRLILEIDHDLAGFMVDRLLGGSGTRATEPMPLSETEEGVIQYLIMQSLADLHTACGAAVQWHFRFEKFLRRTSAVVEQLSPRESVVMITWRVGFDTQLGTVRLMIPHAFAVEAGLRARANTQSAEMLDQAHRFSDEQIPMWVEAGRCELTPAELASVEPGDVVILDRADVHLQDGLPAGRVHLRAGDGVHGNVICELTKERTLRCRVQDVEPMVMVNKRG